NSGYIIFQRVPAGKVVPCPGLGIALDAAVSGTAYNVRPCISKSLMDCFPGNMTHDIGHYRFQLADSAALSFKAAAAVLINEAVILAVIIPYRAGAVFQNIF